MSSSTALRKVCDCTANPGFSICSVPDVDDFLDELLGDRVGTDDSAIQRWVYLEALRLRAFHVHNVDRVVTRLKSVDAVLPVVRVFVHA